MKGNESEGNKQAQKPKKAPFYPHPINPPWPMASS
jgi:hypothetical protein